MDARTVTKTLQACFRNGLFHDARNLFDGIPNKDVVHWTSMMSGYNSSARYFDSWSVFRRMLDEEDASVVGPNAFTVSCALVSCRGLRCRWGGKQVHGLAAKRGLVGTYRTVYVDNLLLDLYASTGDNGRVDEDARFVFEEMVVKTEVTWTTVMSGYTRSGNFHAVIQLFRRMLREEGPPAGMLLLTPFTCSVAIRACASTGCLCVGRQLHACAVKSLVDFRSVRVSNCLLDMYSRCMSFNDAERLFGEMSDDRDVVSWNTMIGGLMRSNPHRCFQLFHSMQSSCFRSNEITLCSILSACIELAVINCGQQIHAAAFRRGLVGNAQVSNALIDMYGKCGSSWDSRKVFDEMAAKAKDVISWTSMMNAYGCHGKAKEAIGLFDEMLLLGVPLDDGAIVGVLTACRHGGLVDRGLEYFDEMVRDRGVVPSRQMYGCLVDLLGRAGRVDEAYAVGLGFDADEVVWSALLACCRMHGRFGLGRLVAKKILDLRPRDETGTYAVLAALSAADGDWEEFAGIRKMMKRSGNAKQVGRSWIEIGDSVFTFHVGDHGSHPERVYDVMDLLFRNINDDFDFEFPYFDFDF